LSGRSDKEHDGRRFVIRTIRNGSVRIFGLTFRPKGQHRKYDGRLDGLRFAFGLYHEPTADGWRWKREYVECWGTEEAYRCHDEAESKRLWETRPDCVDGYFSWMGWYSEHGPWDCPSCGITVAFDDEHNVMECYRRLAA
jgi:hypothetical protein